MTAILSGRVMFVATVPLLYLALSCSHAIAQSPCEAAWETLMIPMPPARSGVTRGVAFDETRNRAVLFGGLGTIGVILGDTWEFDGSTWIARASSGPAPRFDHGMTYDSFRQKTVLFGGTVAFGSGAGNFSSETWEWDGSTWTLAATVGPPAQTRHCMAYDPVRRRTVLYGSGEIWEWDGVAWQRRWWHSVNTPSNLPYSECYRVGASMAYDPRYGAVIVAGGKTSTSSSASYASTWQRWDGSVLETIGDGNGSSTFPQSRENAALVHVPLTTRSVLIGGQSHGAQLPQVWECIRNEPIVYWALPRILSCTTIPAIPWGELSVVHPTASTSTWVFAFTTGGSYRLHYPPASTAPPALGPSGPNSIAWPTAAGGNGHVYEVVVTTNGCGIYWDAANAAAIAAGGHLVAIDSPAENAFVYGLIANPSYWKSPFTYPGWPQSVAGGLWTGPWIGGYRLVPRGGAANAPLPWRWVNGAPMSFVGWASSASSVTCQQSWNSNAMEAGAYFAGYGGLSPTWCAAEANAFIEDVQRDRRPLAYVVEYDPALVCPQPQSTEMSLCALGSAGTDARLRLQNLPADATYGKTLISMSAVTPTGGGGFFGLNADLLTLSILMAPISTGDPLSWTVDGAGVFPKAPFDFPASITLPFAGMTWDMMAIAATAQGSFVFSNIVRKNW